MDSPLEWKSLGYFTDTTRHNLPSESDFTELLFVARMSTGGAILVTIHIPKSALTIYDYSWRGGYYYSANGNAGVEFIVTKTVFYLKSAYMNGTTITSNMPYSVYYR